MLFWTVVLEKTFESPLDCKEIKPVNLKGDQSWIFIGRIEAEAEAPIPWPPDAKNWLIGKDPDASMSWVGGHILQKTPESPVDSRYIKLVHPKGNQSWIFIGRTDAKAESPILWSPDVKNWLIGKDPDAGKEWRQEEKEMTEDEMVGRHQWLNGHEFE